MSYIKPTNIILTPGNFLDNIYPRQYQMKGCSNEQVIYTPYLDALTSLGGERILGNHNEARQTPLGGVWERNRTQLMQEMSLKKCPLGKLELYELEVLRAGQGYLE